MHIINGLRIFCFWLILLGFPGEDHPPENPFRLLRSNPDWKGTNFLLENICFFSPRRLFSRDDFKRILVMSYLCSKFFSFFSPSQSITHLTLGSFRRHCFVAALLSIFLSFLFFSDLARPHSLRGLDLLSIGLMPRDEPVTKLGRN